MIPALDACAVIVKHHDPDRYLSSLFAPTQLRPFLLTLYAFNHELARIGESVTAPMLGEIRLEWWRETLEGARAGTPRRHDVAEALACLFAAKSLPKELFDAMIDARSFDFSDAEFEAAEMRDAYLDATSGNLMRLAAGILGGNDAHDLMAREAGIAYALTGLLRSRAVHTARRKIYLSDDDAPLITEAKLRLQRARKLRRPKASLPAFLPAALVPLYLRDPKTDVPIHRRQLALLGASLRGRI